jgi:hypothetical protein
MSDEEFNSWQKKLVAAIIIALVGGNAGFLLNKTTSDARYDPFTGSEGRAIEHRLDEVYSIQQTMLFRMEQMEDYSAECRIRLRDHLRQHP